MALAKQVISIPFRQGIDTKTDAKSVEMGKLLRLENGVFRKGGEIRKRYGTTSLSKSILGSSNSISDGDGIDRFYTGDVFNELVLYAGDRLYTRTDSNNSWVDKGSIISAIVNNTPIFGNTYAQTKVDVAYNNGVALFAWADSRGGVRASVLDWTTGAQLQTDVQISSSADNPRCHAIGNSLWVFYNETNNLKGQRISVGAPQTFQAASTLKSDLKSTEAFFDIVEWSGTRSIMCYHKSDNTVHVFYINEAGTVTPTGSPAEATISERAQNCLGICTLDNSSIFVAMHNNTNGVRTRALDSNFNFLFALTTLDSDVANNYVNITGVKSATNTIKWFYELSAASTYNQQVKTNTVTTAGSAGSTAVFLRSVGLASKAFLVGSTGYLNLVQDSTLQPTFFTSDLNGRVFTKIKGGSAGGLQTQHLTCVCPISASQYVWANSIKNRIETEANTVYYQKGINATTLNFQDDAAYRGDQLGNCLHVVGGLLWDYDGAQIVEHGFLLSPENVTAAQSGAAGVANGTYGYAVIYQWMNSKREVYRSAPYYLSFTVTGGPRNVTLTIPTLRITNKSNVIIHVFRTTNAGSVYYRLTSATSPTFNNTAADTVSYVDTADDSTITTGEILYTTSGEKDNDSPPSCSISHVHQNRLWIVTDEPNVLWYSKDKVDEEGVSFHADFNKAIDPSGGPITNLASVDDKFIIFKQKEIRGFVGSGPNALGFNDDFTQDALISSDAGCSDVNSVVQFSGTNYTGQQIGGVIFKSDKGFYLLDRAMQVSYIGAPVEGYNSYTVTSATLLSGVNQIRFTLNGGPCLVYDYYFDQWSTFTNYSAVDAVVVGDTYYFLKSDGTVRKENTSSYMDDSDAIKLLIETSWMKFSGLQGFQRIYRAGLLGDFKSSHVFQLDISYDYEEVNTYSLYWNPAGAINVSTFGSDSPYGSGTPYGGSIDNVYQFRAHMPRQQCESIKFTISDVFTSSYGESFSIADISLLVGLKSGIYPQRAAKSI